ncbi:unnamed protein product [Spirodela intermedia]|uniref:Uncharacterized protein n=1 Tax=Spirodela intermedia TaxID=51605 RepID=A0A7I8IKK6_SPIIN|nr:unnamed protein product [Spirodela intermedia]CAA6657933.1 unnamed protein product [Spirodela intermedia]
MRISRAGGAACGRPPGLLLAGVTGCCSLVGQRGWGPAFWRTSRWGGDGAWWRRDFHFSAGSLEFRASGVSCAEYAVDEAPFWEEERSRAAPADEGLEIAKLGIAREIVASLAHKGIAKLFPIQRAVLEPAMQGRDMIGRARTGTGKTLAFGFLSWIKSFNSMQRMGSCGKNPLALVLAPTRELAKQVEKEFKESAGNLYTLCVYGGSPIGQQMRALNYGVDVVVGTPGRVIDLLGRGALNLREVQFVVLDEADQMLNVGFKEDVEKIMESLPENRQTMLFSATMPTWIRNITRTYLKNPVTIDLVGDSDQKLAEGITLYSITSDNYGKASIVGPLITEHAKGGKCIVFTQTKRDTHKCEALHGDISQSQRERTLAGFRDGHFNILVATDVAARGLDIPNVDLYDLLTFYLRPSIWPDGPGRQEGDAILIYSEQQSRAIRQIEVDIGSKFNELRRCGYGRSGGFGSSGGGGRSSSFGGRSGSYGGSGFGGRSGGGSEVGSSRSGSLVDQVPPAALAATLAPVAALGVPVAPVIFGSLRSRSFGDGGSGSSGGFANLGAGLFDSADKFGSGRRSS